eukprot:TRINITY_DN75735_c0_g1_i1.p1 TRINITY_DN75735_c0_g1~~TRINITY_DN75735_c0_g1_i1.p1  ORF type:complete len:250 (+),score=42.39 TRINITY_DN75735_c0_g1_i1:82-750(+)
MALTQPRCLEQLNFCSSRSVLSTSTATVSVGFDSVPTTPRSDVSAPSSRSASRWCDITDSPPATPRSDKSASSLPACYVTELVIRNTFLDLDERTVVVQPRRSRSLEPVRCSEQATETSISNIGVGGVGCKVAFKAKTPGAAVPTELELPSEGSREHSTGNCRPCGFFWKSGGCSNGKGCEFCHLCGPKEKRQRHKEKKQTLKAQAAAQAASEKNAFVIPSR